MYKQNESASSTEPLYPDDTQSCNEKRGIETQAVTCMGDELLGRTDYRRGAAPKARGPSRDYEGDVLHP